MSEAGLNYILKYVVQTTVTCSGLGSFDVQISKLVLTRFINYCKSVSHHNSSYNITKSSIINLILALFFLHTTVSVQFSYQI